MTDGLLLTRFAATNDADAFAQLVHRHGPMVLTAARRMAREDADDVAQAVFMLLAKKAAALANRPSVAGWLYETTRLCARNANRTRGRQLKHLRHLQETVMATAATSTNAPADPAWAGELDDALAKLSKSDRSVVLLRYVEGHTLDATAGQLALTPAAVAKRAERALGRLRAFFKARGYQLTPDQAAMGLVAAVPPESLSPVVQQTVAASGAGAKASMIANAAARTMMLAKVKIAALALVTAVAGGVVFDAARRTESLHGAGTAAPLTPAVQPGPPASSNSLSFPTELNMSAVLRARSQLQRSIPEVRFDGVNLEDTFSFLHDQLALNVDPDWDALAWAGIGKQTEITASFKNETAGSLLSKLLIEANGNAPVNYEVAGHGKIYIGTQEQIDSHLGLTARYDMSAVLATGRPQDRKMAKESIAALFVGTNTKAWEVNGHAPDGRWHWEGDTIVVRQLPKTLADLEIRYASLRDQAYARTREQKQAEATRNAKR